MKLKVVAGLLTAAVMMGGICYYRYKHDVVACNKRILEKKYNREFEIKERFGRFDLIAYPADDPKMIFHSSYTTRETGHDCYEEELILKKCKELANEKLSEFGKNYRFLVDADGAFEENENGQFASDILRKDCIPEESVFSYSYDFFIESKALELSDEELYEVILKLADVDKSNKPYSIAVYFVTNGELNELTDWFNNYPELDFFEKPKMYRKLQDNYFNNTDSSFERSDHGREIYLFNKNFEFLNSEFRDRLKDDEEYYPPLEEFEARMQEVRNNGLYR